MSFDAGRLTSYLAESKTQTDNNALYQTIAGLITKVKEEFDATATIIAAVQAAVAGLGAIRFVSIDTSGGATAFNLNDYVGINQPVVFKDVSGNAAANNITLTGTVDGVANPTINTNFGVKRVYKNDVTGTFNEW